mgnify:FL=1
MSKHSLTRRSEYHDVVSRRFAGTLIILFGPMTPLQPARTSLEGGTTP